MAIKKYYNGSVGPLLYDDTAALNDPDGDFSGETVQGFSTDGQLYIGEAATSDTNVVRQGEFTNSVFPPVSVVDIDSPTELNSLVGKSGALVIAYEVETDTDQATMYVWEVGNTGGEDIPYIMSDGGSGFWYAVAGKYSINEGSLSASRLVATDGSKIKVSVEDLTAWIAGTTSEIAVANDADGSVTLSLLRNQEIHSADDTLVAADMMKVHIVDTTTGDKTITLDEGSSLTLMDWVTICRIGSNILNIVPTGSDALILSDSDKLTNEESRHMSALTLQLIEADYWHPVAKASFGKWKAYSVV